MALFVNDTFTDTDGTSISSHTGETGASWTALSGNAVTPTIQSNALDPSTGADANALWYASGTPAGADYSVTGVVKYNGGGGSSIGGPALRMSTGAQTGYFGFHFGSSFAIYKYVAGSLSLVATVAAGAPAGGDEFTILFSASGTTLTLRVQRSSDSQYLNSSGSWQAGATDAISTTDSSISAAGRAGFWLARNASGSPTLLSLSADEAGAAGITSAGIASAEAIGSPAVAASVAAAGIASAEAFGSSTVGSGIFDRVDDTDDIFGQPIMVLVPNANAAVPYDSGTPTRVVLYAHGAGEDEEALLTDSLKEDVVLALLDAGYILAGSNQHGENWGNQAGVDDLVGLEKYLRDNYNVEGVCIWSQSAGGPSGLLCLAQGKFPVLGWLGTYPVCSLESIHTLGTYTSAINSAFGVTGSGTATYANKTRGHDPALLQGFSWRHVPMRFYASASDTVVPKSSNTDVLAALVAKCAREAEVVACTGNHGDPSHFDPVDYLAFFERCFDTPVALGRPAATKTVSLVLKDASGAVRAGLTGIRWSWSDQSTPDRRQYPTDVGATETSDGSGVMTITVASNLAAAEVGWLELSNSDGDPAQSPIAYKWAGPVEVS